jgi:SAM-dependent methyltransferase
MSILVCPRCRSPLVERSSKADPELCCSNGGCALSLSPFPFIENQPVLVDFEQSLLDEAMLKAGSGASVRKRDPGRRGLMSRLRRYAIGENQVARRFADEFTAGVQRLAETPRVLVIGGGEVGSGIAHLYQTASVGVIGTDIYISPYTTLVADGHGLPFADQSLDGVWIQAVLEHVLDPVRVVSEIHRVLKPRGLVYADTPFMQQVHEAAYDFTRFTLSGHRWLFRHFRMIDAGFTSGPGTALIWAIRYFVRFLTRSQKLATAAMFAFFWLRFFDRWPGGRFAADGASGVFFYGERAEIPLRPKEIIGFYEAQKTVSPRGMRR